MDDPMKPVSRMLVALMDMDILDKGKFRTFLNRIIQASNSTEDNKTFALAMLVYTELASPAQVKEHKKNPPK